MIGWFNEWFAHVQLIGLIRPDLWSDAYRIESTSRQRSGWHGWRGSTRYVLPDHEGLIVPTERVRADLLSG